MMGMKVFTICPAVLLPPDARRILVNAVNV